MPFSFIDESYVFRYGFSTGELVSLTLTLSDSIIGGEKKHEAKLKIDGVSRWRVVRWIVGKLGISSLKSVNDHLKNAMVLFGRTDTQKKKYMVILRDFHPTKVCIVWVGHIFKLPWWIRVAYDYRITLATRFRKYQLVVVSFGSSR